MDNTDDEDDNESEDDDDAERDGSAKPSLTSVPFEYLLMRAVRYMNGAVKPWELAKRSSYWTYLALDCERVDQRAQQIAEEIAKQRAKDGDDDNGDDDLTE